MATADLLTETRKCKTCGEHKPLSAYGYGNINHYSCRSCMRQKTLDKAGTKPVTEKACSICDEVKPAADFPKSKWKMSGLESRCLACNRIYNKADVFNISFEEAKRLTEIKSCAICDSPPDPGKSLHIDHDHETGEIRGVLCQKCNMALGLLEEDMSRMLKAAEYLMGGGNFAR